MKKTILIGLLLITTTLFCQEKINGKVAIAMSDTYQKAYKLGSVYYKNGTKEPFTGILYGKYDNGNLKTVQEYVNGIGNGKWIDYDPLGNKICEGTYKDNLVEGPVKFYYEDGNLKAEGQYLHWKRPIGLWKYYDKNGKVVHRETYTR